MYGRANPKPIPPSYDADDMRAMRAAEERAALEARASATGALRRAWPPGARRNSRTRRSERLWTSLVVPELMGLDLDLYKWRQNQARRTPAQGGSVTLAQISSACAETASFRRT